MMRRPELRLDARSSSTSRSELTSGFSQMACLPAPSTCWIWSKCRCGGVHRSTTSTSSMRSSSARSVDDARDAVLLGDGPRLRSASMSHTATTSKRSATSDSRAGAIGRCRRRRRRRAVAQPLRSRCYRLPAARGAPAPAPRAPARMRGSTCACGIAVSVRWRMSSSSCGPKGSAHVAAIDVARLLPIDQEEVVAAGSTADVDVLAQLDVAVGAEDGQASVAPGAAGRPA